MTAEEMFCNLYDKYGDEFNWMMIPLTNKFYEQQAEKEIKQGHPLYGQKMWAAAKSESNDDVLYVVENAEKESYVMIHLTYSNNEDVKWPRYVLFENMEEVERYLEQQYISEFQ